MKNRLQLLAALAAASLFAGCATLDPGQQLALANAAAGNAVATYLLARNGASAVQPLHDLQTQLPLIVQGKVTPEQLGALNAELSGIKAGVPAGNQRLLDQIGSLVALVSQSASAATNGALTPQQAMLLGYAQNVSVGIDNAVRYWQGGHPGQ